MLDTATFWALYGYSAEGTSWVSVDLKINFLAQIKEGKLIVHGKLIKYGRTLSLMEAEIRNEQGALLAIGTSNLLETSGGQTIADLAKQRGIVLLPKFIYK
ncbi:MAG: PaaI family thioesterase [Carboxydocellales bacterium]